MALFFPRPKDKAILEAMQLHDKFVVGYIGTHGMAHKLDFIVRAAKKIENPAIHFLFIGEGAEKKKVVALSGELGVNNVTFLDSVSKSEIAGYLSVTDVSLVPLRKTELFTTVIPSKIFENAAMEKPILLGVDGEARSIVEHYKAGIYFEPENEADFLEKLNRLYTDKAFYQACQEGGRCLADDFDRKKLALKMLDYLKKLVNNK